MTAHMVTLPDVADLDVEDAKQVLRSAARKNRSRRSTHVREGLVDSWVRTALDFIGDAEVIAAYVSVKDEPPTHELCEAITAAGKKPIAFPNSGRSCPERWGMVSGTGRSSGHGPRPPPGARRGVPDLQGARRRRRPARPRHPGRAPRAAHRPRRRWVRPHSQAGQAGRPHRSDDLPPTSTWRPSFPQDPMDVCVHYVILPDRWGSVS